MPSPRKRARHADSDDEATPTNFLLTPPSAKRVKHGDSDAVELMDVEDPVNALPLSPSEKSSISSKSPKGCPKEVRAASPLKDAAQAVSKAGTLHTPKALSRVSEQTIMTAAATKTHEAYVPKVLPPSLKGLYEHSSKPVAFSVQKIPMCSTSMTSPSASVMNSICRKETVKEKIECGLKEARKDRAEGVEKLSPECTVTANETDNLGNKNFAKELNAVEEKLDTESLPLKRPSVYIVRSKARLVRRIPEAHAASSLHVATASAQYATPPPSDPSSSPPRKYIAPNSPESKPMRESAAPKKVIYQSTGVQTLPPGDNNTFRKIYGRAARDHSGGLDPAGTFTCGDAGLSAMGRFGKDVGIHTYDLIYGRRFQAPVPVLSVDFQDQGFQIMEIPGCEKAIKKAKLKAAMQVMRLKPWMDKIHYKAFPEPRENLIVHSEQRQVWVEMDKKGRVEGTAPFPNVVCSETYSTGPPEPISVFLTYGDDTNIPFVDDITDFMEYPMPDWDTDEFVVQTVPALPLDCQMQTFEAPTGSKTISSVASIKTGNAQSMIRSKATRTTVEREHSFDSAARVNKTDPNRMASSTEKTKLISSVACIIDNSIDVPTGSTEPHKDPLYSPEDPERSAPTKKPRPDLKTGESHTPIIRHPPREESTLKVVPREKGLSYSADNPRFGTSKITSVNKAKTSDIIEKTSDSQKVKKTSTPPSTPRTQSISITSAPSATPQNRLEKQTNCVRKTPNGKTRAPEPDQRRKATARKEASQLPNALFGAFRRKMDKESNLASQHNSSALQQNIMGTLTTSIPSPFPIPTQSPRRCDSLDAPSGISGTLSTGVPSASTSQHTLPASQSKLPTVSTAHNLSLSPKKRSRYDEDEDLVDYSDSELIPSPKKQRLEGQEGDSSKLCEQATKTNSLGVRATRDLDSNERVAQQSALHFPHSLPRQAPAPGVSSQKNPLQQLPPRTSNAPKQSPQQAIPQLQRLLQHTPSRQISTRQTPSDQAPSEQTPARRAPSHQVSSQKSAPQDAASQQSTLQPARRKQEPRQSMNWALSLAGTGLLLSRKEK